MTKRSSRTAADRVRARAKQVDLPDQPQSGILAGVAEAVQTKRRQLLTHGGHRPPMGGSYKQFLDDAPVLCAGCHRPMLELERNKWLPLCEHPARGKVALWIRHKEFGDGVEERATPFRESNHVAAKSEDLVEERAALEDHETMELQRLAAQAQAEDAAKAPPDVSRLVASRNWEAIRQLPGWWTSGDYAWHDSYASLYRTYGHDAEYWRGRGVVPPGPGAQLNSWPPASPDSKDAKRARQCFDEWITDMLAQDAGSDDDLLGVQRKMEAEADEWSDDNDRRRLGYRD